MARLARAVFPGHPHHVTQRGNGRQQTFFSDSDYSLYRDLLAEHAPAAGLEILVVGADAQSRPSDCRAS